MGHKNLNNVLCATCRIHGRGVHYRVEEAKCSDSKATSVTRYQKRSYRRERTSGRGP